MNFLIIALIILLVLNTTGKKGKTKNETTKNITGGVFNIMHPAETLLR